jgi:molybdate transport system substrate-binding protein
MAPLDCLIAAVEPYYRGALRTGCEPTGGCLYNLLGFSYCRRNPFRGDSVLMRRLISFSLIALVVWACWFSSPRAEAADHEVNVAAAADLSSALEELGTSYEKRTGVTIKLSFGASGALTQQIQNGAPFDIFFSADMDYPRQLIAGGQADGQTLYLYAVGRLVLWVPMDSPLDVERKGMDVLLDPSVKKISIGNPQHAPYGRAAVAALNHYGLYGKVSDHLVLGENISQAAQFVESGNAQVGFVALAHATASAMRGKGKYWIVPAEAYPALDQGVIIISRSPHKPDAAAFLDYVKTTEGSAVLEHYGFTLPGPKQGTAK